MYAASVSATDRKNEVLKLWVDPATNTYQGSVTADLSTTLMKVAQIKSMQVIARSAVSLDNNPVCILLTAPKGVALDMGSSSEIRMPGCEVDVKSKDNPAAKMSSSAAVNAAKLCVEGKIDTSLMKSNYAPGCSTIDDQWASKMPGVGSSTCTPALTNKTYNNNNAPTYLDPGTICDGMTFNSSVTITFKPGLYRVRNGAITFKAASRIIAKDVTFYFEDEKSRFKFAANSQMEITAPTTGVYANIAIFVAPGLNPSTMDLVCGADVKTSGLFYLPSRNISLDSSAGIATRQMTLVGYTLAFSSSSTLVAEPIPDASMQVFNSRVALTQ